MPLMRCTNNGVSGWKFGESGKCYTGPDAKKKAAKQGRAIEVNKSKGLIEKVIENLNVQQDTRQS